MKRNIILLASFLISASVLAQNTGGVKGVVKSNDGQTVPYVTVMLKGSTLATTTNNKGEFSFLKVTPGEYSLQVSFIGFEPQQQQVNVVAGQIQQIDFILGESSSQLDEIVITGNRSYTELNAGVATRLNTPLRDVPQSIQVVNKEMLKDRQIQTIAEATKVMAGINAYSSSQYSDYTLRGFRSSPGNFAYNGIRGDFFQFDQATLTYNLEKIEAIKGPASVLFSAGNPGGVINHVTKKAQSKRRYEVELTYGSFDQFRAMVDATGKISQNGKLLYRAVVGYEKTGQLDPNLDIESIFFAPQLQYNFSENTSLNYELNYGKDDRTMGYQRGVPAFQVNETTWDLDVLPKDFTMIDPNGYSEARAISHQISFNHQFNSKLKFTTLFRAVDSYQDQFDVSPGGFGTGVVNDSLDFSHGFFMQDPIYQYQSSSFLTYSTDIGQTQHSFVVGFDYSRTGRTYEYGGLSSRRLSIYNLDFSWATYDRSDAALATAAFQIGKTEKTRLIAGYFQDQITLGEKWKALLGFRIEKHDYDTYMFDLLTEDKVSYDTLSATAFTPRAGFVFQPTNTLSAYVSYSQGFIPQYGSMRDQGGPFPPEKSRQYEIGIRNEFFNGKLFASVAGYYIQKYDVLTPDPTDADGLRLLQMDDVYSKGIELSLQGELTSNLSVIANYALNKTYTPGDVGFDYLGEGEFPNAPRHNANLWAKYRLTELVDGLSIGAGLNHIGKRYTFIKDFTVPAYTTVDAMVSYRYKGASLNLNIYNVTNTDYFYGVYGPANLWPGNPSSFRVTAGYVF
jgi:iron complex outermembrane recepter protein